MSAEGSDKRRPEDILYEAFAQCYFENAFFGTIKTIDNSLVELLRFGLTILTADALIMALTQISGSTTQETLMLFLSSCCAFLISSLILLWAFTQRAPLEVTWDGSILTIIQNCRESMETLYMTKRKKQKVAIVILIVGVALLFASIISVIYKLKLF
jgi:hypothetical protein